MKINSLLISIPGLKCTVKRSKLRNAKIANLLNLLKFPGLQYFRRMARYCDFGWNLDISVRDRFVCGLKNEAVVKKLLQEKDLDLPKAIAIATATEIASRDAAELGKGSTTAAPVHSIRKERPLPKTSSSPSRDNCFRCGRMGHTPQNCKCKEMDCLQCGKRGHIARTCPAKNNSKPSWSKHQRQPAQHRLSKTHALEEEEDAMLYNASASSARAKALIGWSQRSVVRRSGWSLTPGPLCRLSRTASTETTVTISAGCRSPTSVVFKTYSGVWSFSYKQCTSSLPLFQR